MYQSLAYKHAVYLLQWTQAHTLALVLGGLSLAIIGGKYKTAGLFFVGIKHIIQRIAVKKMAGILYHARNM